MELTKETQDKAWQSLPIEVRNAIREEVASLYSEDCMELLGRLFGDGNVESPIETETKGVDLKQLDRMLDEALASETKESLERWLERRKNSWGTFRKGDRIRTDAGWVGTVISEHPYFESYNPYRIVDDNGNEHGAGEDSVLLKAYIERGDRVRILKGKSKNLIAEVKFAAPTYDRNIDMICLDKDSQILTSDDVRLCTADDLKPMFQPGDTVRILRENGFYHKEATIKAVTLHVCGNHSYTVNENMLDWYENELELVAKHRVKDENYEVGDEVMANVMGAMKPVRIVSVDDVKRVAEVSYKGYVIEVSFNNIERYEK